MPDDVCAGEEHRPTAPVTPGGTIHLVNADPLTGEPAVLGEVFAEGCDDQGDDVLSRSQTGMPFRTVQESKRTVYDHCLHAAAAAVQPSRFVFHLEDDGRPALVEAERLALAPEAELRFQHRMLATGAIGVTTFLQRVPAAVVEYSAPHLDPDENAHLAHLTRGVCISGGPATGVLVPSTSDSRASGGSDEFIVAVDRVEAYHTDVLWDERCAGLLAVRGSPVDHFALLAGDRRFGYMALPNHRVDTAGLHCGNTLVPYGSPITVDFATGDVYAGVGVVKLQAAPDPLRAEVRRLLEEQEGTIPLRVTIDNPDDLAGTLPTDAAGIGLIRTEHMLRRRGLAEILRTVVSADDDTPPREAVTRLGDFFEEQLSRLLHAAGRPATVRLLDYPLHELGGPLSGEVNPMLGLRGVRQGVRWPVLYRCQIGALLRAAVSARSCGVPVPHVEIMVPLVVVPAEVRLVREWLTETQAVTSGGDDLDVRLGAMVETPAAAAAVEEIAEECDFVSFGTNDLTQFALGLSREDYLPVLELYRRWDLIGADPFTCLPSSVVELVRNAAERARRVRPEIDIGCCGVHATDPQILELARRGTLDHVSVPPPSFLTAKLRGLQLAEQGKSLGDRAPGECPADEGRW